ncbi:MAG: sialate O-acetylesterase [Prevotella sp.]
MNLRIFALATLLCCTVGTQAQVKLQPLFTDNMVMQQQAVVPIWGETKAGKKVVITTSWDNRKYAIKADSQGKWVVRVHTPTAGGPYTVKIDDGKPVTLHNVLIGEVWLCGGQSNMEFKTSQALHFDQEQLDAKNHPTIRFLHVVAQESTKPKDSFKAVNNGWEVCSAKSIAEFSAIGYFFAKNIEASEHVPVGIIQSCLGATPAEAYISTRSLKLMPEFCDGAVKMEQATTDAKVLHQQYLDETKLWEAQTLTLDPGFKNGSPIWATTTSDEGWLDTKLPGTMNAGQLGFFDGIAWTRTTAEIPASWAGQDIKLFLGGVDDDDITFYNGVEIGSSKTVMVSRQYTIPGHLVKPGKATIAVRINDTGGDIAIYGNYGKIYLENEKGEKIDLSGIWKSRIALNVGDMPRMPRDLSSDTNVPGILYNTMIHPLKDYTIKGALWYQGETNDGRAYQYRDVLKLLVNDWRSQWGYNFPVYVAQLPNYRARQEKPGPSKWAEMRESQAKILELSNTGIATLLGLGEADNIHPKNKQEAAQRLALVAQAKTYSRNVDYSGPTLDSFKIDGNRVILYMQHAEGGLKTINGEPLKGFQVAGFDHRFYWATAKIEGSRIIVTCPDVPYPLAVRYAWADNPDCNLINGAGLPAGTFRTDDWLEATYGCK